MSDDGKLPVSAEVVPRGTKRGVPNAPKGRKKGQLNIATRDVRAAVALIAENNVANVQKWLERTARKQPARALQLYLDLIEYHIPKLARTEHTGEEKPDGTREPIRVIFGAK